MTGGRLIWLAWERQEDGSFRVVETREGEGGGTVRRRREFASLGEAAEAYGPRFREVTEEVVDSGSDRGRFRP